jgi:phosphatidylserine/phosphatidylglycerophosphate/cardiolipin synthase-like enzyme
MRLRVFASLLLSLLLALPAAPGWARDPLPASGSVEFAFTPGDDAEGAIVHALGQAHQAVYVQAYLFTSRVLAHALIEAWQRGVKVEVLADREMLAKGENSLIPMLAEAGIPVGLETRYAVAHNKIILIDPQEATGAVITGSYNFTYSAQARNAENLLILRGNPALARAYFDNWQRHRSDSLAYPSGMAE